MTTITVGSICGSPGATTLAMGIAAVWPTEDVIRAVVEADPAGGRLGAELGVGVEPGLVSMSLAARTPGLTADTALREHGADMHDWWLVPGPPSGEQASSVLARSAPSLARLLGHDRATCVVDAGRLSTRSPAMALAIESTTVVLVSTGDFAALQLVPARVASLTAAGCRVGLVVSGSTPWPAPDIASFVGCDVLALLPGVRVRRGARSMSGGEWSKWWSATRDLAGLLCKLAARHSRMPDRALEAAP